MHNCIVFARVLIFCHLFFSFDKIVAQNANASFPIDSVIKYLEQKRELSLYVQYQWFKNKGFHPSILQLSTNELLNVLEKACNCSTISVDSSSIVFIPNELAFNSTVINNTASQTVIGNPNEYGKYSRATIVGKIIDGKTGEPLIGAKIYVNKLNIGAVTDKTGIFNLSIPVGDFDIKLSYIGYEDNQTMIEVYGNGTATFDIIEKTYGLNEVIITTKRLDNNLLSPKMGVVTLNNKDIKELPVVFGETDILKSVTLLPGVQTVGEFGTGFNVHGGGTDQNLILIEDVPIFNSAHLFGLTSIINPDGIADITLIKAGIPAKYGERVSSVMNMNMGTTNTDKIKVKGGIGLINSRLTIDAPLFKNKVNLMVGGRSTYSNWLLHKMPDVDLKNSSAKFYDLNGFLTIIPDSSNKISVFGYFSDDDFSFIHNINYKYNNVLASIKWNHIISKKLSVSIMAGFSKYDYNVSELDSFRRSESYRINSEILYRDAKLNFSWHPSINHAIDVGVNGIFYAIKPGDLKQYDELSKVNPILIQLEKANEFAVYATDELNISQKFGAEIGVRYSLYLRLGPDSLNNYKSGSPVNIENITYASIYKKNQLIKGYSGVEPRISLLYSINGLSSIKMSYSHINQYINLISNSSVMNPSDVWQLSDPYEKPLKCDQLTFGYFRNFSKNAIETSIELYYKTLRNIIEYKNGAQILLNSHIETDLVNAKGYNYGAELFVKKNFGRLTGWVSYTYSRSMRRTTGIDPSEQINSNKYFPSDFDKPHNIVVNANYHLSRRWRLSGSFLYSTGRPTTLPELKYNFGGFSINSAPLNINSYQLIYYSDRNSYRLPDYNRLDVSITFDESLRLKKKWKGSWTLSIVNLYGRKNVYSIFYQNAAPSELNNYNQFSLYKLYIIGTPLPTLTYNFIF